MRRAVHIREQIGGGNEEASDEQVKKLFDYCLTQFRKGKSCNHTAWQIKRLAKDSFYGYLAQAFETCQNKIMNIHDRNHQIYLNLNLAAAALDPEDSEQRQHYSQAYELADGAVDIFN